VCCRFFVAAADDERLGTDRCGDDVRQGGGGVMSCTHDEGDGAGLAIAIAGSKPMVVTPSLGACVDVVCTFSYCVCSCSHFQFTSSRGGRWFSRPGILQLGGSKASSQGGREGERGPRHSNVCSIFSK